MIIKSTRYTSGPWTVDERGKIVASSNKEPVSVSRTLLDVCSSEGHSNALLMSAAPELVENLAAMVGMLHNRLGPDVAQSDGVFLRAAAVLERLESTNCLELGTAKYNEHLRCLAYGKNSDGEGDQFGCVVEFPSGSTISHEKIVCRVEEEAASLGFTTKIILTENEAGFSDAAWGEIGTPEIVNLLTDVIVDS